MTLVDTISRLQGITREQARLLLDSAVVEGKGVCTPPPLDLDAIRERADELDPKSQLKADIYCLLIEIETLRGNS